MRVQTGRVATVELTVDVQYRCSSCGKDNLTTEQLSGTAQTGTILGIDLDQNLSKHAQEAMSAKLSTVLDPDNPERFREARFTCKCQNCGYAEPWARMNYDSLNGLLTLSMIAMPVFGVLSLIGLSVAKFSLELLVFLVLLGLSVATYISARAYKNKKNIELEQQIAALPKESLPTILPHSKERHDAFYCAPVDRTPQKATYGKWICQECGAQNSMQFAQCKKCGKFKHS